MGVQEIEVEIFIEVLKEFLFEIINYFEQRLSNKKKVEELKQNINILGK